jgi:hypothetical protein
MCRTRSPNFAKSGCLLMVGKKYSNDDYWSTADEYHRQWQEVADLLFAVGKPDTERPIPKSRISEGPDGFHRRTTIAFQTNTGETRNRKDRGSR